MKSVLIRAVALLAAVVAAVGMSFVPAHASTTRLPSGTYTYTDGQPIIVTTNGAKTGQSWVIVIHGGGWISGDPSSMDRATSVFHAAGYTVFNVAYPLLLDVSWHRLESDVFASLTWVRAHATRFGANPTHGAVFGFSSGGHLAAMLGLHGDGHTGIRAIVTASGVVQPGRVADDALGMRAHTEPATAQYKQLYENEILATGCARTDTSRACVAAWHNFSPQYEISRHDPPVLMFAGTSDPIVPHQSNNALEFWLHRSGIPATVVLAAGTGHAQTTALDAGVRQRQMLTWLKRVAP